MFGYVFNDFSTINHHITFCLEYILKQMHFIISCSITFLLWHILLIKSTSHLYLFIIFYISRMLHNKDYSLSILEASIYIWDISDKWLFHRQVRFASLIQTYVMQRPLFHLITEIMTVAILGLCWTSSLKHGVTNTFRHLICLIKLHYNITLRFVSVLDFTDFSLALLVPNRPKLSVIT